MKQKRSLFNPLTKQVSGEEILLIVGPRQTGKTTLLHQVEESLKTKGKTCHFLNLEDPDYLKLLNQSPKNLFRLFPFTNNQFNYLFIDEVQYLDNPSNFLKYFYDEYRKKIKIIASGSSAFYLDKKFKDSLAGRKKIFTLYTLSFPEFLSFKNEPELAKKNFSKFSLSEKEKINILYSEYITWGGYPKVVLASPQDKLEVLRDLAYSYIKKDIFEANIRQDEVFYKLLKILSSQIGSLVNSFELSNTLGVSKTAIDNYLYVMQKSFHLSLIKPFHKNIRKELTKMPKAYFLDLGLRNFFKNNFQMFAQRDDKGQLLENAVFRQLVNNYEPHEIKFWRTTERKEIDFVIEDKNLAFEVKSGPIPRKTSRLKIFKKTYPQIKLSFISLPQVWQI